LCESSRLTTISLPGTRTTICTSGGLPLAFLALVGHLDHHPAADDVIVKLLQLVHVRAHGLFEGIRGFKVVEGKFERNIHDQSALLQYDNVRKCTRFR